MADIFISYSSRDRHQADQLTELLGSAGLSVWIDQSGIDVATSWSGEIVDAIEGCKAFVVLLSENSIASHNVIKEVSLAAERQKKILPLDLEPVALPRDLAYHLAGIQRAPMTNIDAVIRALAKLGLEATGAPVPPKIVKETDGRKSLMILPFEDLSPTADNEWFANGIVSELISALTNVKDLKLTDAQTTKEFKRYKGHLAVYAKEMDVRYFVQGDVRKFGDQIKISSRLLDIETGDHLWQGSLKGTMDDVFEIQETVAKNVADGLNIILTAAETKKIEQKATENAEAYELWLKGREYFTRQTKIDYERALRLFEEAVRLDPKFAAAYVQIANCSQATYRQYSRNPDLLVQAEAAAKKVFELEGETPRYFWVMSSISLRRGDAEGALRLAKRAIEIDPGYALGYDALGFAYQALGMKEEAVQACEEYVRHQKANNASSHFNLLLALHELGAVPERLRASAEQAIPVFERHVRLAPDDYNARVAFANVLQYAARNAEALALADELSGIDALDGFALYNLACLYLKDPHSERGMTTLRRAVEKGFKNLETFRRDPDLDPLRGTSEFEALMKELEEKLSEPAHPHV